MVDRKSNLNYQFVVVLVGVLGLNVNAADYVFVVVYEMVEQVLFVVPYVVLDLQIAEGTYEVFFQYCDVYSSQKPSSNIIINSTLHQSLNRN